jgi:hypothetical protein
MTDQDIEDLIADAISDSLEMDWTSRDGARAVVAALREAGAMIFWPTAEMPMMTPGPQEEF